MIEIKNIYGDVIYTSETATTIAEAVIEATSRRANLTGASLNGASLNGASLYWANLTGASLNGANLTGANLTGASLNGASLNGANLTGASLNGASLNGASLNGAKGINLLMISPLPLLRYQVGPIRLFKLVTAELLSPMVSSNRIHYEIGSTVESTADRDESVECSYGISLATLDWCMREWKEGHRILICEFMPDDLAAIPVASDGKVRVDRCKVISELPMSEWGEGPWTEKVAE